MDKNFLIQRLQSFEADASKPLSKVMLANQSREQTMESKGQDVKTECVDRTKDTKEHHSDKAVTSHPAGASVKETGFCSNERKGPQNDTKIRKYKHNSATWGVALRKPSRIKRKIRAYSPSREWNYRKRAKLGLGKGGKYDPNVKKLKSKVGPVKQQGHGESKENSISAGNGDVSKCKTIPDVTTDMLLMSDPEGHTDEFKHFMKEEIKRQILNGLGEACKSAQIERIEVEQIGQYTASNIHELEDSGPLDQHYMAKMKLNMTLLFPVTLRAVQGPPQDLPKPTQVQTQPAARPEPEILDGYQLKGIEAKDAESVEDANDIKEHESTGEFKDTREVEPRGPMKPDTGEPETRGLIEPEKFHNEPLLENECSREVEVPESEFYDFECERSADKFSPGQVWASYDSRIDIMPRDYIQIEKVVSISPLKLQITLLRPTGFPNWVKAGNTVTCGEFNSDNRLRGMDQIDGFSHIIKWEKGQNGMIYIYPAEREVWALYKDWKELDPNRRIKLGFEIVQIVAVEKDVSTVSVVPLVNFKGSRTVFVKQEVEPSKIHQRDFVKFSHQIPTYEILDEDGCMELDPAATPH